VLLKVADGVVAALHQLQVSVQVGRAHLLPVQYLVTRGDQGVVTLGPGDGIGVHGLELVDELGAEVKR